MYKVLGALPVGKQAGIAFSGGLDTLVAVAWMRAKAAIINTSGPAFSYHPDKHSMERTENAAFGPVDRIGQLTMRNLDIADTRAKLELYCAQGQLGEGDFQLVGQLETGGADAIASSSSKKSSDANESLDCAAMETGSD